MSTIWAIFLIFLTAALAQFQEIHPQPSSPPRRAEFVSDLSPAQPLKNSLLGVYIPSYVELRGGSWSTVIHGIYVLHIPPGNGSPGDRPVYRRISMPELFLAWVPTPKPRWVLAQQIAFMGTSVIPYAELHSSSLVPAFSRGWYVQPETPDGARAQMPLDLQRLKGESTDAAPMGGGLGPVNAAMLAPHAHQLLPGFGGGNPNFMQAPHLLNRQANTISLKFDKELICDEARPDTFSTLVGGNIAKGCMSVSRCHPPISRKAGTVQPVLDFVMYGADNLFNNTLLSHSGSFLRRPYYEFRSPLNPAPQHGISEVHANAVYMWAEGVAMKTTAPIWYISRELGNKNAAQLLAVWKARDAATQKLPANYPAQPNLELRQTEWKLTERLMAVKNRFNQFGGDVSKDERVNIKIRGLPLVMTSFIVLRDGPAGISGEYYFVGEYLGYPFYRQNRDQGLPGYAMYRGFCLAADKDTWIVGSKLGSSASIHAYAEDNHARIPSFIKVQWVIWDAGEWKASSMSVHEGGVPAT